VNAQTYLDDIRGALDETQIVELVKVVDRLYEAFASEHTIFTFGNGASAALASHMATDMGKLTSLDFGTGPVPRTVKRLRIASLCDNSAWLTAIGNDLAYEDVFLEQLKNQLVAGDVVIGISGSGGSPNVLKALRYARASGAFCIAFTGAQPKAANIEPLTDVLIRAPLTMMEQIEDLHVVYHHIITRQLFDRISTGAQLEA